MRQVLPTIVVFIIAVSYGIAEGWWTHRWNHSEGVDRAAARCADVPRMVGWEGADQQLDAAQIALAKIEGYMMRRYVHRQTGDTITVMLVCGRPGPIALHTPDICFPAGGLEMKTAPERVRVEVAGLNDTALFWAARFDKPGPGGSALIVRWAWATNGYWSAADSPRIEFARSTALYKLYVIHPANKPEQQPGDDPDLDDFLRVFLPSLQDALFSAAKN